MSSMSPAEQRSQMSCSILAFPLSRRRAFVRRHAAIMASLSPAASERHLTAQLRLQGAALVRRGIEDAVVKAECRSLETAIRVELLRTSARGGAA
jgi:hypothetical protein